MNILFIHSNIAQFKQIHCYFQESGLAQSYLLCSKNAYKRNHSKIKNLIPFEPYQGKLSSETSWFHIKKVEEVNRRSIGLLNKINELLVGGLKVDVIVCHGTAGAPLVLFDHVDIPIITYIEFPSFRQHGWDVSYPPPQGNKLRDANFEALSYFSVLKSLCTIVPSEYAKSMFPSDLQHKIVVQMEGFLVDDSLVLNKAFTKEPGVFYVGFAARDLSSAKGVEKFVEVSVEILKIRDDVRFVVIGSEKLLYSYEFHKLKNEFPKGEISFFQYVLDKYEIDLERYIILGTLDYDLYASAIYDIDLFLYPVQFSSASWGLFELLSRGRIVVGSDRCYFPEIIEHGVNGFLVDYHSTESWVLTVCDILDSYKEYRGVGLKAMEMMGEYATNVVARKYLSLIESRLSSRTDGGV